MLRMVSEVLTTLGQNPAQVGLLKMHGEKMTATIVTCSTLQDLLHQQNLKLYHRTI